MTNSDDRRRGGNQSKPENRRKSQRRKDDRYRYDVDLVLEREGARMTGRLVDINMSGLCADLDSAPVVATGYTLHFSVEARALAVPVRILWSTPVDKGKRARVGVEFSPLGATETRVLTSCIEELIRARWLHAEWMWKR